jgi:type II secretory pathway predicted ATPase ExeA
MYLEHFGLNEAPFRITPHTDFFFEGANRGATLEALLYAITHDEGIVKISGEVGSGKTMLCRVLMERLPESVETIFLANPSLSRDEIMFTLADELKVNLATNRVSAVMRALQEHLIGLYSQGRQVVVLIDEAHAMPAETLEEIRLLSNLESNRHKLLQIVLFGQPELNEVLNRTEMRQLKERITHNFTLEPLVRADVAQYINFRMRTAGYKGPDLFSASALKRIASASLGLTRRINILCDKALLAAFAGNTHQITVPHVKAAIRDAEFRGSSLPHLGYWLGGAVTALLIAGAVVAYYPFGGAPRDERPAVPAATAPPVPSASAPVPESPAPPQAVNPATDISPAIATAAPLQTTQIKQPPPGDAPTASPSHGAPVQKAPAFGQLTRQRLEETRKWLDETADNRWFIQLLSTDAGSAAHVEGFLASAAKAADADSIRVYMVESRGIMRLGVIYGEYPSRAAATQALNDLPAALKVFGPYPRQVRRLRG